MVDPETMLKCFDTVGRDNARTPMQWDDSENAGFPTGTPWIAVNPNYVRINAKEALSDEDSVFYYYQKLIRLRHENEIIVYGVFEPLMMESDSVYAYQRKLGNRTLTVACNWTEQEQDCSLFDDPDGEELISNYAEHKKGKLQPYEARAVLH
jgi:oligo-1,6-glucosidase